jgi:threonyl-tRNA synthetase
VERFFAILLEHYAGALPTWLMPVQVVVLPVRDDHDDYAREVAASLGAAAARVEVDVADEPLNARIRRWKLEKVPYILVVGDTDVAARTVGVNARSSPRPKRDVVLDDFVAALAIEIATKGSPETDTEREPADPVGE